MGLLQVYSFQKILSPSSESSKNKKDPRKRSPLSVSEWQVPNRLKGEPPDGEKKKKCSSAAREFLNVTFLLRVISQIHVICVSREVLEAQSPLSPGKVRDGDLRRVVDRAVLWNHLMGSASEVNVRGDQSQAVPTGQGGPSLPSLQ